MDKGLEALKDLSGSTIVSALGLGEGQVKQLAKMLGVESADVEGKTFKDIGEMAQAKIDATTKIQTAFRGKQASGRNNQTTITKSNG